MNYQLLNATNFTQGQFVAIFLRPTRICNAKGIVLTLTRQCWSSTLRVSFCTKKTINRNEYYIIYSFFRSTHCENYLSNYTIQSIQSFSAFFRDTKSEKNPQTFSGWWLNHPSEKYARQIGSSPQVGVKIKNLWNHHLVIEGLGDYNL